MQKNTDAKWQFFAFLCLLLALAIPVYGQSDNNRFGLLLNIDGAIGPATQSFVENGLQTADDTGAHLVILRLDTPGGLSKSTRGIVKAILSAKVPVVTYVAPSGARAASAGTYILYASHIAAMAPGTNLGAATPVAIGGGAPLPQISPLSPAPEKKKNASSTTAPKTAMEKKVLHDATAYITSLAELRKRNVKWAQKAVREGVSISASEALKNNVINEIAPSIQTLLTQIDGYKVTVAQQLPYTLNTAHPHAPFPLKHFKASMKTQILSVITDPNVAYILLLIGIYGLFLEFAHPGAIIPGVIGSIALVVALYALQMLPINYAGLALMLLGIAFIVAEVFVPSFGVLGIGGVIAFAVGSVLLLEPTHIAYTIFWPLIAGFTVANLLFFFVVVRLALKAHHKKIVSGQEGMLNAKGHALDDFKHNKGRVLIEGEIWQATCHAPIQSDQAVRVVSIDELILVVEPIDNHL